MIARKNSRSYLEVRDISFKTNPFGYAESSVLYQQGGTKVYVCVGLQMGVPKFLRGIGDGWLTAEYVMHPYASEKIRSNREVYPNGRDFRSIEISRMIGRSFRSVVNLKQLGERTIFIDCDVLQADGGTRTACINATSLALKAAENLWLSTKRISASFLQTPLLGVSVGFMNGGILLDLDKTEDSSCIADFNFIMTPKCEIVEIQGTAEVRPVHWENFDECRVIAVEGVRKIKELLKL